MDIKSAQALISRTSLVLRQSLSPLMIDRPNSTKLEIEGLEELKWRETGLDRLFLRMS